MAEAQAASGVAIGEDTGAQQAVRDAEKARNHAREIYRDAADQKRE